jgi:ABC-type glycerol-3-phosphate transport system substrate-binding protein
MNISKFQIITLAIFVVCIIAGVAGFALYKGKSSTTALPAITIWGTFPAGTFSNYVSTINNTLSDQLSINYVEEKPETFTQDFVNALATGRGPDAVLIPSDMILPQQNKLTLIPYKAFPQRSFMDTYIQEAQIYLFPDGILAVPFTVDPLMMYWNRDTFNAAGLAAYPRFWDEFTGTTQNSGLAQKLTTKDANGNIRKTALAMGDFSNITNARELFGSLILQLGNPITVQSNGIAQSTLKSLNAINPAPAVDYFSQFVDPSNINYSWNRGLPNDKTAFLSSMLATYFGFASEIADIRNKNPNLNFDIAPLPQIRQGGLKASYGRMYGFSLVRASQNANASYQIISILTTPDHLKQLSQTMYLPTVRNDLIAQGSTDPYITIFNQAALTSRTWLDASPAQSRQIFGDLVQSITSGQKSVNNAIQDAGDRYDVYLRQAGQ